MLSPQRRKTEAGGPSRRARVRGSWRSGSHCHSPPPRPDPHAPADAEANPKEKTGRRSKMEGGGGSWQERGPFHPRLFPDGSGSPGNRFSQTPPPTPAPLRPARCEPRPRPLPAGSISCRSPTQPGESVSPGVQAGPGL